MDYPVSAGGFCDVYFAKLDEASETPRDVAVERLILPVYKDQQVKKALVSSLDRLVHAFILKRFSVLSDLPGNSMLGRA